MATTDTQQATTLPLLFAPAFAQVSTKWAGMDEATRARLVSNLPTFEERIACLKWNSLVSTLGPRFLEPCQAVYGALMSWDTLSPVEQIVVFMAGIEPIAQVARKAGFIKGA